MAGRRSCNLQDQCSVGNADRRMIDVRLAALPQTLPCSTIGRRLVCKQCGTTGSLYIVPSWHDRAAAQRLK